MNHQPQQLCYFNMIVSHKKIKFVHVVLLMGELHLRFLGIKFS